MSPRCKILIIDDDQDDIGILSETLALCGADSIHYVFTAVAAFAYLESVDPANLPVLIISDHYLPGITGFEFMKDLKSMEKYKHILVIILSSHHTEDEIRQYCEMGALDYLEKPSTYDEYVRVAAEITRKARL